MKKILTFAFVLALALALAVPCFASAIYPALPKGEYGNWVIVNEYGSIGALNYNLHPFHNDTTMKVQGFQMFGIDGGIWVSLSEVLPLETYTIDAENILYNSAGFFPNKVSIALNSGSFTDVIEKMGEQITVATVVQVLVVGATAVVGLVFMWWGVRKLSRALFKAFRKGKVSL